MDVSNIILNACLTKDKSDFQEWNSKLNKLVDLEELDGRGAKLVPYFLSKLSQYELESVHQVRLKIIYRYFWLKSNFLEEETKRICELFKDINVKPLIFKGMNLAYSYDKIAYRPTSDLDVLIPYDRFKSAMKLLKQKDYKLPDSYFSLLKFFPKWNYKFNGHAFFLYHKVRKMEVDVHWNISHVVSQKGLDFILENAIPHPKFENAVVPIIEHEAYLSIIHGNYSSHHENWAIDLLMMKNLKEKFKIKKLWDLARIDGKMDVFQAALFKLKKYEIDFFEIPVKNIPKPISLPKKEASNLFFIQKLSKFKRDFHMVFGHNLSFFKEKYLFAQMLVFKMIYKLIYSSKIIKHVGSLKS